MEVGNDFHITTCHAPKDFKATVTVTAKDPYEFSPGVTVQTHTMGVGDIVGWDVGNKENPLEERMSGNIILFKVDVEIDGVGEDEEVTEGAWAEYFSCNSCDEANHVHTEKCRSYFKPVKILCLPAEYPNSNYDFITLAFNLNFLLEQQDNGQLVNAQQSYLVKDIAKKTFFLHGHAVSGSLRDYTITATHSENACYDIAAYTVTEYKIELYSEPPNGWYNVIIDLEEREVGHACWHFIANPEDSVNTEYVNIYIGFYPILTGKPFIDYDPISKQVVINSYNGFLNKNDTQHLAGAEKYIWRVDRSAILNGINYVFANDAPRTPDYHPLVRNCVDMAVGAGFSVGVDVPNYIGVQLISVELKGRTVRTLIECSSAGHLAWGLKNLPPEDN